MKRLAAALLGSTALILGAGYAVSLSTSKMGSSTFGLCNAGGALNTPCYLAGAIWQGLVVIGGDIGSNLVTALGGTAPISESARAAFTLNVRDFGAVGDDTADDTNALDAMANYARSAARQIGGQVPRVTAQRQVVNIVFPLGVYRTTHCLNWEGLTSLTVNIQGNGSEIDGQVNNTCVVTAFGDRFLTASGLMINGNPAFSATVGFQYGRLSTASADDHHFLDFTFAGNFSLTAVYSRAAETTTWSHLKIFNETTTAGAYGLILDGYNHFNVQSPFSTTTLPQDTAVSFDEPAFENASINVYNPSGTTVPLWIGGTNSARFTSASYMAGNNVGAVVYGVNTDTLMDVHFETAGLTDVFQVDGPASSTAYLRGFKYFDSLPEASNSIFKTTSNVIAVSAPDMDVRIGQPAYALKLFDAPALWAARGFFSQESGTTAFNATSANFHGTYCLGTGQVSCVQTEVNLQQGPGLPILALGQPSNDALNSLYLGANTTAGSIPFPALTTGGYSVAIGSNVLQKLTTGQFNVGVGPSALANTNAGSSNAAFGFGALTANKDGSNNLAIGSNALNANVSSGGNVALGVGTLKSLTAAGATCNKHGGWDQCRFHGDDGLRQSSDRRRHHDPYTSDERLLQLPRCGLRLHRGGKPRHLAGTACRAEDRGGADNSSRCGLRGTLRRSRDQLRHMQGAGGSGYVYNARIDRRQHRFWMLMLVGFYFLSWSLER